MLIQIRQTVPVHVRREIRMGSSSSNSSRLPVVPIPVFIADPTIATITTITIERRPMRATERGRYVLSPQLPDSPRLAVRLFLDSPYTRGIRHHPVNATVNATTTTTGTGIHSVHVGFFHLDVQCVGVDVGMSREERLSVWSQTCQYGWIVEGHQPKRG
jgi:hypothetical protein